MACRRGNICRALTNTWALFAIGNRKSKIAIVAVPVVQRIEQGFPKPKLAVSLQSSEFVSSTQTAVA
jgi:hypothetical protein